MRKELACAWGVLMLSLLAACGGTTVPTASTQLPIEILGEPGLVESATIAVSAQPSNAAYLWLKTHRLTWREDGEFATTSNPRNSVHPGSKGSVRLNGGPWVPLTNSTVTCEAHEAAFGEAFDFALEVSSPGIDQTGQSWLQVRRQHTGISL